MSLISQFLHQLNTFLYSSWKNAYLVFFTISVLIALSFAWIHAYFSQKHRFPLPPGPRGLPIIGNLPFLEPEIHSYFASLAQKYGPILTLKLGKKVSVVISSPAMACEILKQHDTTFANRDISTVVMAMEYGGRDIVFTPYGPEWRMLRKVCVRGMLGEATLEASYNYRKQEIQNTIRFLYNSKGSPVNVGEQMFLNVLNVVTNMLWGGTIQGNERSRIGAEFRQVVAEITELLGKPNISDFFPSLAWLDLQGMNKQMKVVSKKLENIFDEIIRHKSEQNDSKDFLQVLLQLRKEKDAKTPLTTHHIKALLMDMVVGSTDTTTGTIEFAMAEMMQKPEVMIKAQEELETIVGKYNIVEEFHIHKLPYLHAVMKEVLRLHPALPLMVPHCPSKPCAVGDYTIPKGARIFVNVWAIHRDPSIWMNPTEFIPERFLSGDKDYIGNDFSYIPFGSGRRICAGMAMGERMVMFSLASLIHSFDWKLPVGEQLNLSEKFGIVLKKRVPLVLIPVPRLYNSAAYD